MPLSTYSFVKLLAWVLFVLNFSIAFVIAVFKFLFIFAILISFGFNPCQSNLSCKNYSIFSNLAFVAAIVFLFPTVKPTLDSSILSDFLFLVLSFFIDIGLYEYDTSSGSFYFKYGML